MTIQPPYLLRLPIIFALASLSGVVSAEKPSVQAARELLSHSPWTIQVEATMDDPADVPEISTEVPRTITQAGQPNVGNGNTDINTRWDGQIGKSRMGRLATIPVMVRWDSALVIRHALEERHEPDVASLTAASANHFVLTVVGLLPAKNGRTQVDIEAKSSSGEAGGQARSAEEILEWFMGNSLLMMKGKTALRPENVQVDADTGTVHLFFDRSDAVIASKREIDFVTRYGAMSVQAKFRPKEMQVGGKPDL